MAARLEVRSFADPRDLGVNIRFRGNQVKHPRARAAQELLTADIVRENPRWEPCDVCRVRIVFVYPDNRSDIDGPIKRTLDAVEAAVKEMGHKWHDGRVHGLEVYKRVIRGESWIEVLMNPF